MRKRLQYFLALRTIRQAKCIIEGKLSLIGKTPEIRNKGKITLGDRVIFSSNGSPAALICQNGAEISIGAGTFLNSGVRILAASQVLIGKDCKIGNNSVICDANFHQVHEGSEARVRPIRLGKNVWLARNVIVLPGVTIGDHSVIGAGSVVSGDIPAKQIWAGNPATYVKDVIASDNFVRC